MAAVSVGFPMFAMAVDREERVETIAQRSGAYLRMFRKPLSDSLNRRPGGALWSCAACIGGNDGARNVTRAGIRGGGSARVADHPGTACAEVPDSSEALPPRRFPRSIVRALRNAIARCRRVLQHHLRGPDGLNFARRHMEQGADQAWALVAKRVFRRRHVGSFDGDPRFALLTVNFSTTHYLKLLLLTLCEQQDLGFVHRIVIADNDSRDGGQAFLRALSARVARVELVQHRRFLNHARGMRGALRALDRVEAHVPEAERTNLLLFCDTDVVFRNPEALFDLAAATVANDAALVGELRKVYEYPDVQASFFVVRRESYERSDVAPWMNHASPAYA